MDERTRESLSRSVLTLEEIWEKFAYVSIFLKSSNSYCKTVRLFPWLLYDYLNVEQERVTELINDFKQSIDSLKGIDTESYFMLKGTLKDFEFDLNEVYFPTTNDKLLINDNTVILLNNLLDENLDPLKAKILEIAKLISEQEHSFLKRKMAKYESDYSKFDFEVPDYLLKLINSWEFLKEKLTKEDLNKIYSTPFVMWLFGKFRDVSAFQAYFELSKSDALQVLMHIGAKEGKELAIKGFWIISDPSIQNIEISSTEENRFIIKNAQFKSAVLLIMSKIYGNDNIPEKGKLIIKDFYQGKKRISVLWKNIKPKFAEIREKLKSKIAEKPI